MNPIFNAFEFETEAEFIDFQPNDGGRYLLVLSYFQHGDIACELGFSEDTPLLALTALEGSLVGITIACDKTALHWSKVARYMDIQNPDTAAAITKLLADKAGRPCVLPDDTGA
jgi:hypothetical protein